MAFGRSEGEESGGGSEGRIGGNRPDCAYFLLLGLCGAAFLLTIGGILTYIAFNPGSVDSRPHSPLSHIPHFHHHRKHHDRTEGHFYGTAEQQHTLQHHEQQHGNSHHPQTHHPSQSSSPSNTQTLETTTTTEKTVSAVTTKPSLDKVENNNVTAKNGSRVTGGNGDAVTETGAIGTTPENHFATSNVNKTENKSGDNVAVVTASPAKNNETEKENEKRVTEQVHDRFGLTHRNYNKSNSSSSHHHHPLLDPTSSHHLNQQQPMHPHPGLVSSVTHHEGNNSNGYEYQAKQSLALAIIGPLCLLMGIVVTLIVGVFALKYDCDHEPEPNIAFLRLRSEMSLNFDPSKNNYELLMPASSSSAGVGSTHSIHPGGMPRC